MSKLGNPLLNFSHILSEVAILEAEQPHKASDSSVGEPGHILSMVVIANSGTSDNTILGPDHVLHLANSPLVTVTHLVSNLLKIDNIIRF